MHIFLLFLFLTNLVPGAIQNFTKRDKENGDIVLRWDPPVERGGPELIYIFEYGNKDEELLNSTYTIHREDKQKTVKFKVLCCSI